MNLEDELRKIDEFFESKSHKELECMLIKNGAMDDKYKLDSTVTFAYRNNDSNNYKSK